jgi:spore coat polysaccharide biosynthesis protein SpsF
MPRIIASIEARMGSSRLPGKVLKDICGKPALTRLLSRLRRCELLNGIVLATSSLAADDPLEKWARGEELPFFRGSEDDVLLRVVEGQRMMQSDVVVEITGDCILLDPELIDMGIKTFLENDCDLVTNVRELSFPPGMDIQVFRLKDLEYVERNISDPAVREHVSLYFYEHPELYRIIQLYAPKRWHAPEYRFMLDYPEDYSFINEIYSRLEPAYGDAFGLEEIMQVLRLEPSLLDINRHCEDKPVR